MKNTNTLWDPLLLEVAHEGEEGSTPYSGMFRIEIWNVGLCSCSGNNRLIDNEWLLAQTKQSINRANFVELLVRFGLAEEKTTTTIDNWLYFETIKFRHLSGWMN